MTGPEIRPLGHGLDAIVLPTRRPLLWWERLLCLRSPELAIPGGDGEEAAARRQKRYSRARRAFPSSDDHGVVCLREIIGFQYQDAWRQGLKLQFRKMPSTRRLQLVPVR